MVTQAVLNLAVEEHANCILHLHGGSNSLNDLLQTAYVPLEINEAIRRLAERCHAAAQLEGLEFTVRDVPSKETGNPPPSFNLASAAHHVCGAVSAVFESNQCISDLQGPKLSPDEVYRSHMILFEQCFRMFAS